jgi:hypothetical protein
MDVSWLRSAVGVHCDTRVTQSLVPASDKTHFKQEASQMPLKIVIFGSGGVGGYFGAKLAVTGNDVAFLARGQDLDAKPTQGFGLLACWETFPRTPFRLPSA